MTRLTFLAAVIPALALGADKPAAVQVCLTLPEGVPLFAAKAARNYRALPDGSFMLDFDVTLNGRAPEKLTKSGAACFRAWLPARNVQKLAVDFSRTDLNLVASERAVDLKMKPDLWYDGGAFAIERAPWSKISTALPGTLTIERQESAGPFPVADHSRVPTGQYVVKYEPPPPPPGSCELAVRVVATGTVREDNKPELVAQLADTYKKDWAPGVAKELKMTCTPAQSLELELRIVDGTYFKPLAPKVTKITVPEKEPKYELVTDGVRSRFTSGQAVSVGVGQSFAIEDVSRAATVAAAP